MDPVSLASLASWVIGGFVSELGKTAGSRVGKVVFGSDTPSPDVATRDDLVALEERLLSHIRARPDVVPALEVAVREDLSERPTVAKWVERERPGLIESALSGAYGITPEQARFQGKSRCPIGGERLLWPPSYFTPDGRRLSPFATFRLMRRESPVVTARCKNGHTWQVFAKG